KGIAVVPLAIALLVLAVAGYFAYQKYSVSENQTAMKDHTSLAANNEETDVLQATSNFKPLNPNLNDALIKEIGGSDSYANWSKQKTAAIIGMGRQYNDNFEDNDSTTIYKELKGCYFFTRGAQAYKGNYYGKGYTAYTNVTLYAGYWGGNKNNSLVAIIPNSNVTDLVIREGAGVTSIVNDCGSNMLLFRGPVSLSENSINNFLGTKVNYGTAVVDIVSKGKQGANEVFEVTVTGAGRGAGQIMDIIKNNGVVRLDGPNFQQAKYTILKPQVKSQIGSFSFEVIALPNTLTFYVNSGASYNNYVDAKPGKIPAGWKINNKMDGLDRISR
ncbi:MAG: hypothetical protein EBV07_01040, partial [Proteobacteria bacterium]|nr:hypothetical protein [Pseudomonadota bacterium]